MQLVRLSDEQHAHMEAMKALAAKVHADDRLRWEPDVMRHTAAMLERASELNMGQPFMIELQLILSHYQSERMLPPHLRNERFKEGWDG